MKNDFVQKSNQSTDDQLQAFLDKANEAIKEIDGDSVDRNRKFSEIESKVDESIIAIEKTFSELDQIEKESGDELDALILQQAEELAEK